MQASQHIEPDADRQVADKCDLNAMRGGHQALHQTVHMKHKELVTLLE